MEGERGFQSVGRTLAPGLYNWYNLWGREWKGRGGFRGILQDYNILVEAGALEHVLMGSNFVPQIPCAGYLL